MYIIAQNSNTKYKLTKNTTIAKSVNMVNNSFNFFIRNKLVASYDNLEIFLRVNDIIDNLLKSNTKQLYFKFPKQ